MDDAADVDCDSVPSLRDLYYGINTEIDEDVAGSDDEMLVSYFDDAWSRFLDPFVNLSHNNQTEC